VGTLASQFQGEATAVVVDQSGDNVVRTPGVGAKLRVYWIGMITSQGNAGEVVVEIRIGSTLKYSWVMGNPGIFSHRDLIEGEKGEALIVNLSQAYPVHFNYTFEEVY
jgi:hypothetical protein